MVRQAWLVGAATVALALSANALAGGTGGKLDHSFSGDGKLTLDIGSSANPGDRASGLTRLPGGDLLAVGVTPTGAALAQIDSSGAPVASFGGGDGMLIRAFGNHSVLNSVIPAAGGKAVAVGTGDVSLNEYDLVVTRFDAATGDLDPTFNAGGSQPGVNTLDFPGDDTSESGRAVATQGSKLVVAGSLGTGYGSDTILARFKADGTLDSTFGDGGLVRKDFAHGDSDNAFGVAVTPGGEILVGGDAYLGSRYEMYVARFKGNGKPDHSFGGGDGIAHTKSSKDAFAIGGGMAVQDDGAIVLAGYGGKPPGDFVVARFRGNGKPDKSFGGDGSVFTAFGKRAAFAHAVAIGPSSKLVVAGYRDSAPNDKFALARYRSSGKLDRGFGSGGKVITELSPGSSDSDHAYAVIVQPDGRPVLAGFSASDFGFTRYRSH
jgi:uncharacterized delta-60 repeat protein